MNIRSFFEQHFPPRCLLCQAPHGPICRPCLDDLPWLPEAHCLLCAQPTAAKICGACLKQAPAFSRVTAPFSYAFPVDRLIQRLKYEGHLSLAQPLGALLAPHVQNELPDLWLPVPLSAHRLRERGFNQAVEIARELAAKTGVPMQATWARRIRDTPPQAGLKREARKQNLRGAFQCSDKIRGLHVGIVDDVMTTGSTLDELARTLLAAGARKVSCAVVARA